MAEEEKESDEEDMDSKEDRGNGSKISSISTLKVFEKKRVREDAD